MEHGYGIVQWTWNTRKEGLYKFAKSKGVSIADEDMQIEYLLAELNPNGGADGYASYVLSPGQGYTIEDWKTATTPEEAAKAFCGIFEKGSWSNTRSSKANEYYNQFKDAVRPTYGSESEVASNIPGIKGKYTSSFGKTYTEYWQNIENGCPWYSTDGCFHCTLATVLSAYGSQKTPNQFTGFSYRSGCYGYQSDAAQFGCQYPWVNGSQAKTAIKKGEPIMLEISPYATLTTDNGTYTRSDWQHWVAVLDYKIENGKEKVYIHNPWKGEPDYGWTNMDTAINVARKLIHIYK